jgi:hypothetical protein
MTSGRRVTANVLLCVLLFAQAGFGWNGQGHMIVAYVAYQKLTKKTRTRVGNLMKLNPYYGRWVGMLPAGTPAKYKRMMIFMIAATWPDQIKSDATYSDDGSNNGNTPGGAPSSQNTGYSDLLRHKYFHFVDTPFSDDGTTLPAIPDPNAEERIDLFRGVLAGNDSDELKSYDMVWLLHLVGDVHQPLHATTRVSSTQSVGDAGGNLVKICNPGCNTELHAIWDNLLGTSSDISLAVTTAKALPKAKASDAAKSDAEVWVQESFDAAKSKVYVDPIKAGAGPFTLNAAYKSSAKTVARKRVALAGERLANLLNDELK